MSRTLVWTIAAVAIIMGGYWYVRKDASDSSPMVSGKDSYAYTCDDGSQFTMTPSRDMSEVTLVAGSQDLFTGTVRLFRMGEGNHFETTSGQLIVLSGAGEEAQLTVGSDSTTCHPMPSADGPPWHWGDAGEGGGTKQDVARIVSERIVGKWQSVDDAKYVREFKSDGTVDDRYDGTVVSSGAWVAFGKGARAPEVPYPLEDNAVYVQIAAAEEQADTLNFKLTKLTSEELELIYLDRGGVLRFKKVR